MKTIQTLILLTFCIIQPVLFAQDKTSTDYWDELHYALKYKIDKNEEEPHGKAPLEEFLRWIHIKGADLREVKEAFQELNLLYNADPENEVYKKWMAKFFDLVRMAEFSGTNTVNGATMVHMQHDCNGYSPYIVGHTVREKGRQIYSAAIDSGFDPNYPIERSRCLINCAIGLLESDRYGFSLYRNRERLFGYLDEEGVINDDGLDFANISCERRGRFFVNSKGEPAKELTYAFENVGEIMVECDWWGFTGEKQDARDLLIEYYKDALCKQPPHQSNMGHKFYREMAEQHDLNEAVDFNKGFYGVLFGKVEVEEEGVKKRAPGAKVAFESVDEKWEATADEKGEYRFEKVILHKHCSPFHIYAEYKGDRVDDEFKGTLEEPNPNAIRLKNLLIKSTAKYEWKGRLTFEASQRFICTHQSGYPIEVNKFKEQLVDLKFSVEQISFQGMSPIATIGDIDGSGTIKIRLDDQEEEIRTDYYRLEKWNAMNTFSLSGKNLVMTIQKKMQEDQETLKKRLEELAKTDPTKLIQEIQLMNNVEDKSFFEVDIYILISGDWPSEVTSLIKIESKDKNKNNSKTEEQRIGIPMALKLTGNMNLNTDGTADITAFSNETEYLPNGTIADFGCPPITSMWKFEMQLHKKKTN